MDTTARDGFAAQIGQLRTTMQLSRNRKRGALQGRIVHGLFFACAVMSIVTTFGIVVSLLYQSLGFFREIPVWDFLFGTTWSPILKDAEGNRHYGVLPLVSGTLLVASIAAAVAVPAGLAIAIFLSEYAPDKVRRSIKPILEVLAGIPTVVYGYFALTFITPLLQGLPIPYFQENLLVFNALSAGLVMGLMIIPMVSSLSEDAMVAVPRSLRHAAYALGGTRLEVSLRIVVPAAFSGIVASFILAFSRAIGGDDAGHSCRGCDAASHLQPRREHPGDDGLYRATRAWGDPARLSGVQHHIRRGAAPLRLHPRDERARTLPRPPLPGGVLAWPEQR